MQRVLVTGSSGLIGSEAVASYDRRGIEVTASTTTCEREFFGPKGDTGWNSRSAPGVDAQLHHHGSTSATVPAVFALSETHTFDLIIHCAAQPSHDRARDIPLDDFDVNAVGTLNLLEATRRHAPESVVLLHEHEQGLRRRPERACRSSRCRPGGTTPTRRLQRHHRVLPHRPVPALALRRLQGRRRRDDPGVWPLLRHEDRRASAVAASPARTTAASSCTASSATW